MAPRVLLVDDQPDVIDAVKKHLQGYDVQTVKTFDGAKGQLRSGDFQLVLCDRGIVKPEDLTALLRSGGDLNGFIIDGEATRGTLDRKPIVYEPDGMLTIDLDAVKMICAPEGQKHGVSAADLLRRRIFAMMSEEPSSGRARTLLEAFADTLGAHYAAYVLRESRGVRLLYEYCVQENAPSITCTQLAREHGQADVRVVHAGSRVWLSASDEARGMILAAFDGPTAGAIRAFAECARPAAAYLRRCLAAPHDAADAEVFFTAVSSLIHDTRCLMSGLALSLWSGRDIRQGRKELTDAQAAVLARQLGSLTELCAEYSRVHFAMTIDTPGRRADLMVGAFAGMLRRLGIETESLEADPSFQLPTATRGTLARALVQVGLELVQIAASHLKISCRNGNGRQTLEMSFCASRPWHAGEGGTPLAAACDLVTGAGGQATVEVSAQVARLLIDFPQAVGSPAVATP